MRWLCLIKLVNYRDTLDSCLTNYWQRAVKPKAWAWGQAQGPTWMFRDACRRRRETLWRGYPQGQWRSRPRFPSRRRRRRIRRARRRRRYGRPSSGCCGRWRSGGRRHPPWCRCGWWNRSRTLRWTILLGKEEARVKDLHNYIMYTTVAVHTKQAIEECFPKGLA